MLVCTQSHLGETASICYLACCRGECSPTDCLLLLDPGLGAAPAPAQAALPLVLEKVLELSKPVVLVARWGDMLCRYIV